MKKTVLFCVVCSCFCFFGITQANAEVVIPGTEAATTSTATEEVKEPTILQMGDGRFYHPETGKTTATYEGMLRVLRGEPEVPVQIVIATSTAPVSALPPIIGTFPLREAIAKAKAELQVDIDAIKKKTVLTSDSGWREVRLKLWDPDTDQLSTVDISKNGTKIKIKNGGPRITIPVTNGINSTYKVMDGSRKIVVAINYPIYIEKVITKKKKQYTVIPTVYTPYSPELATPEMIAWGRQTLDAVVDLAFQDLRTKNVRSWAFPDRLLADVIDPSLAKAITVIEHTDESSITRNLRGTMDRFFVTIGTNENTAFSYAKSTASALGIAQFIPSTYKTMVKRHPELELIPDFEAGMRNIPNAIVAEVAYLDDILASMPSDVRGRYLLAEERSRVREYMTAAYNGGTSRVGKAMALWDDLWNGDWKLRVAKLEAQHKTLTAEIKSTQKKIKAAKTATIAKQLKTTLANKKAEDGKVINELAYLKNNSLRTETIGYITKYRQVIKAIEGDVLAVVIPSL